MPIYSKSKPRRSPRKILRQSSGFWNRGGERTVIKVSTFATHQSSSSNDIGHRQSIIAVTVKDDSMLVVVIPILVEVVLLFIVERMVCCCGVKDITIPRQFHVVVNVELQLYVQN
jgi:hypothetical protein